ncbi:TOMM precursor leader peptide-binding protein [Acrocarpospora catenulata]|uniref:TOMM precursor leader peptide-binding protein n=1 Tax=Acrocarpospora catenulata TaxID=2836182 RepID=UPI001BDAD5E3|nr:TOMM precursor leader peptide-binding protein [Acrocarpospora catenulata]
MESIAPGHHLYVGPDGTWRSCDEQERFARISGPPELLARMRAQAYQGGADPELEPLTEVLRARGVVREMTMPDRTITVSVRGGTPVAAAVAELLAGCERVTVAPPEADADVLVVCAGWLPDSEWLRLDATGVVWHRCHVEGTRLVLGPMTVPGETASYRDLRGRRLAAAALPDELAAYWAYLESGEPLPPVTWPNQGAVALAAGLLVNDVLTWRDTGRPAAADRQLVVDPATGEVTRHPVLPLPLVSGSK